MVDTRSTRNHRAGEPPARPTISPIAEAGLVAPVVEQDDDETPPNPHQNAMATTPIGELAQIEEAIRVAEEERDALRLQQRQERLREVQEENARMRSHVVLPSHPRRSPSPDTSPLGRSISEQSSSSTAASHKRQASITLPSRPRKTLRPEKLPLYYGKNVREYRDFIRNASTAFRLVPADFPDDKTKILFAMMSLAGEPKSLWYDHEETLDLDDTSWEYFTQFLLNLCGDPANRQLQHAQQYQDAKQGPNQTAQSFSIYLAGLEAQLPPYTEEQRVIHFFTRLRPDLRRLLANYQDIPKTWDGIVALATKIEMNNRQVGPSQPKPRGQNSPNSNFQKGKRTSQTSQDSLAYSSPYSGPKQQESKKSLQSVECYKCHKKGHYANKCPENSNPNYTPVNQIEIKKSKASQKAPRWRQDEQTQA